MYRGRVMPDMLCHRQGTRVWIEAKCKRRMHCHPATGFEERLYADYLAVQQATRIPVFVVFKDGGQCYGGRLDRLEVYKHNFNISGRPHILFSVPGNFRRVYST